jgi:integrase
MKKLDLYWRRRHFECPCLASCFHTPLVGRRPSRAGLHERERTARKAKQFLYPSEFLALASCPDVPLACRRAVAIAIYTYLRDGELRAVHWDGGDVDLEHGVLSVTKAMRGGSVKPTKTGQTRRFLLEATLLPLLRAMHKEAGHKGPVVHLRGDHMARLLRRWLHTAGVRRPELHHGSPTRKPLTWHDLRATGATWMAVRGDDPLKSKQRCGHATFSTTELYIREAEASAWRLATLARPSMKEGRATLITMRPSVACGDSTTTSA